MEPVINYTEIPTMENFNYTPPCDMTQEEEHLTYCGASKNTIDEKGGDRGRKLGSTLKAASANHDFHFA